MALRLDSIRSIPSCLGLLLPEEIWLQLRNWGAGRDRIRCNLSAWGSCTAAISTDGMDLGGTPSNLVGFPPGTRNRCGLGSCSAGVGFYLLQLRVTGPTPGSRQGTCSFSLGGSLYYSCIKFVNGLTLPLWGLTLLSAPDSHCSPSLPRPPFRVVFNLVRLAIPPGQSTGHTFAV